MKHRIITSKPHGKDTIFGSKRHLGGLPIQAGGQWDEFLPPDDIQNTYCETQGCASWGTLNATEILKKKLFGDVAKSSNRFLAKISETQPDGNDPHKVAETLRKKGCADDADWPWTPDMNTWEKFYSVLPDSVIAVARLFIAKYMFVHEYVKGDPASMMAALEYSPLGVAVWAWNLGDDGLYIRPEGMPDVHWCVCYGYEKGKYWKIFDSYAPTKKRLVWNFGFKVVKRYGLNLSIVDQNGPLARWFQSFVQWFRKSWGFVTGVL